MSEQVLMKTEESHKRQLQPPLPAMQTGLENIRMNFLFLDTDQAFRQFLCLRQKKHQEDRQAAATKIQAGARGFHCRRNLRKEQANAIRLQAWLRCVQQLRLFKKRRAGIKIQSYFRAHLHDKICASDHMLGTQISADFPFNVTDFADPDSLFTAIECSPATIEPGTRTTRYSSDKFAFNVADFANVDLMFDAIDKSLAVVEDPLNPAREGDVKVSPVLVRVPTRKMDARGGKGLVLRTGNAN